MNIVFLDGNTINPGDLSWDLFNKYDNFKVYNHTHESQIIERAQNAEVLITNKQKLNDIHFSSLPNLKLICVASAGYDIIDTIAAKKRNILVANSAGYGTETIAQMVLAHLLNVTNQVHLYSELNRKGEWSKSKKFCYWRSPIIELKGKTATIIGLGKIGIAVSHLFHALGLNIQGVSSNSNIPAFIKKVSLEDAFKTSDIISLNCSLNDSNKNIINKRLLNLAKSSLILINTARGGLVVEEDIIMVLKKNKITAYCTDVLRDEPPQENYELLHLPNAYVTPHIAWASLEARKRILQIITDNIDAFLNNHPQNIVNL